MLYFRSHVRVRATERVALLLVSFQQTTQAVVDQSDVSFGRDDGVFEFQISERRRRRRSIAIVGFSLTDRRSYSCVDIE